MPTVRLNWFIILFTQSYYIENSPGQRRHEDRKYRKKKHPGAGIVDHQGKGNCVESFWDAFLVEINAGEVGRRDVGNFCGPGINYL